MTVLSYVNVTSSTVSMASNNCYVLSSGGPAILTLPTSSSVGDVIQIVCNHGYGATWTIAQNSGQKITYLAANTTTTGITGSVSCTQSNPYYIICVVANTTWSVLSQTGSYTYT